MKNKKEKVKHHLDSFISEVNSRRQEACRVKLLPQDLTVIVEVGKILYDIIVQKTDSVRSDCGGKGKCAQCRVKIESQDGLACITGNEKQALSPQEIQSGIRLACQARIVGDVEVQIPENNTVSVETEIKSRLNGRFPIDSPVKRIECDGAIEKKIQGYEDLDFREKLYKQVRVLARKTTRIEDVSILRKLSQPSICKGQITLVDHADRGITAVYAGLQQKSIGAAVDIGTTSLAIYLCDLKSGKILTSEGGLNPQGRYGEDVLTRIDFTKKNEFGLQVLRQLAVDTINKLIRTGLARIEASESDLDEIVVVGNPTMIQVLAGFHPHYLAAYPFTPFIRFLGNFRAIELQLAASPGTNVFFLPMVTGYVGGDTIGAILADGIHEREEITLLLDIGTNGELVLGNRGCIWTTSCATGPALEGANIACGMRAHVGAIHTVTPDLNYDRFRYHFFGENNGVKPMGLCGSAIIDIAAAMLKTGLIEECGKIRKGMPGVISEDGTQKTARYILVDETQSGTGRPIFLSTQDIRQVQLAKAALNTGITLLRKRSGIKRIDRIVLTGSFGSRFNPVSAFDIGLFPSDLSSCATEVMDNAAGIGAVMCLLDQKRRLQADEVSTRVFSLELAKDAAFAKEFSMQLPFSHH